MEQAESLLIALRGLDVVTDMREVMQAMCLTAALAAD
jgi:hypothetical protein